MVSSVSDAKGSGVLADWRRETVREQALEGIEATKRQFSDGAYETFLMLHGAAIELSKLKGRQPCLPEDYKDFGPLAKLLSTEDITKAEIKRYCKDNKLPNPLGDQARVQHEVYVWEQVRLIAVQEDKAGALKRLKVMANEADNTTIRDLAKRVLEDIAGFEPKAAMKKKDLASDEGLPAAA